MRPGACADPAIRSPRSDGSANARLLSAWSGPSTGRRWTERLDPAGTAAALLIAQRLEVPDIVARVLAGRGVPPDQAAEFLAPKLKSLLPDPSVA